MFRVSIDAFSSAPHPRNERLYKFKQRRVCGMLGAQRYSKQSTLTLTAAPAPAPPEEAGGDIYEKMCLTNRPLQVATIGRVFAAGSSVDGGEADGDRRGERVAVELAVCVVDGWEEASGR